MIISNFQGYSEKTKKKELISSPSKIIIPYSEFFHFAFKDYVAQIKFFFLNIFCIDTYKLFSRIFSNKIFLDKLNFAQNRLLNVKIF